MGDDEGESISELLGRASAGNMVARQRLFEVVETQLRGIAAQQMRGQPEGHTLQPTALINETYLRLFREDSPPSTDRRHFFSLAARAMRHILTDYARRRGRQKRASTGIRIEIEHIVDEYSKRAIDLLALDAALLRLESLDPALSELVHLRFFNGLSMDEISRLERVPLRTLERRWKTARAWLHRELSR